MVQHAAVLPPNRSVELEEGWEHENLHLDSATPKIPLLSFFTGAGFLDLGFSRAGFDAVWHNEIDPWFTRGFEYGMRNLLSYNPQIENQRSIVDVGPNEIVAAAFGSKLPKVFGMIGGPPCPDFSVGGKNRGEHGDRGKLSAVFVNRICEIRPTFFVFENVKGLFKTAVHRAFLNRLVQQLRSSGYVVDIATLNALSFGVPQDRERVFMVGVHKDHFKRMKRPYVGDATNWFPWPYDLRFADAKKRFLWPSINPFGSKLTKPKGIPDELMVWSAIGERGLGALPNGKDCFTPYSDKFGQIPEGDTSRKSFKRLHRWRFSPTAAYGNNEVHLHPTLPRRLTVRETMRIQTAPDGYSLPPEMPLSYKFKTIGNAVPVQLAHAVAIAIRTFLES